MNAENRLNYRYLVGNTLGKVAHAVLSSRIMPLTRYVPVGTFWLYDVQRFAGTRNLRIVFDVGANIGQTAYGLVRYLPHAQIFCVEPVGPTLQRLKSRYAHYHNIQFVQLAFGSRREQRTIPLHKDSERNTLCAEQLQDANLTGEIETVTVETIDNFCRDHAIDRIDILKMDVQGWELEALRGADIMLSRDAVQFVMAEVAFRRSEPDMQHFAELNDFMQARKFNLCGFYDTYRYGPAKQFVGFSNALYINTHFRREGIQLDQPESRAPVMKPVYTRCERT